MMSNIMPFLKTIMTHLQADAVIDARKVMVCSHVPAERAPPYIELRALSCRQMVAQDNKCLSVSVRIVSSYLGDAEMEMLVDAVLERLTGSSFKNGDQTFCFQGKLGNRERKQGADGRIQNEWLTIQFFIARLYQGVLS